MQEITPLKGFDVYVVGFHCEKDNPGSQMEAHHYCRVVNDDLLRCVLFDGNTRKANLIGVEYIVSEKLPEVAEKAFLGRLMNSYGSRAGRWSPPRTRSVALTR